MAARKHCIAVSAAVGYLSLVREAKLTLLNKAPRSAYKGQQWAAGDAVMLCTGDRRDHSNPHFAHRDHSNLHQHT